MNRGIVITLGSFGFCLAGMSNVFAGDAMSSEDAPSSFWRQDTITGNWDGWRSRMTEAGIDFSPVFIGEVMGDVSGGLYGTGAVYE